MRGSCSPAQPVHDALAAEAGAHLHEVVRLPPPADDRRLRPSGWARMAASRASASSAAQMATSLPSLATLSGSRPSSSQAASTFRLHRNRGFLELHADAGLRGDLVERGGQAAAGGVAQHVDARHRWPPWPPPGRAARPCRRQDGASKLRFSRLRHDGHAVVAERAGHQHAVARPGRSPEIAPSGTTPTPVVVMNTPSPLPCSTTLVSPVTMGTPASRAAAAMESTMRQVGQREAFLQDEAGREVQRARPITATSLTVPCTDRQPMSPPGKNSGETTWLSVAITRRPAGAAGGAVVALGQRIRCRRRLANSSLDQLRHRAAAAPWLMSTWPCFMSSGRA
jgi:hypothetical protein